MHKKDSLRSRGGVLQSCHVECIQRDKLLSPSKISNSYRIQNERFRAAKYDLSLIGFPQKRATL